MGLFSGISKAVGSIAGALSGGGGFGSALSIGSALLGGIGQERANDANVNIAGMNNATALELANTQYQRRVKDLTAAGLNPMIAYMPGSGGGSGGAAVPNLQQARVENSATPAIRAGLEASQMQLISSQVAKEQSQADLNSATAAKVRAETPGAESTSALNKVNLDIATSNKIDRIFTNSKIMESERAEAVFNVLRSNNDYNTIKLLNDYAVSKGFRNFEEAMSRTEFSRNFISNYLESNKIPASDAQAEFSLSDYGKNVAPYVHSASEIANSASRFAPNFNLHRHSGSKPRGFTPRSN